MKVADFIASKAQNALLTDEHMDILGIQEADYNELRSLKLPVRDAFEIPYFDIKGGRLDYKRWRYTTDIRSTADIVAGRKELRYIQPPKSHSRLYFPPLVNWEVVVESKVPLIITEGEFKAACCTANIGPCIGLGGVYCFKSKRLLDFVIPDFSLVKWRDRAVVVLFDSDSATNIEVIRARNALCQELLNLGAMPSIATIPANGSKKYGIDDYMFEFGIDACLKVIDSAESWRLGKELFKLNEEVAYIKDPGFVAVLGSDRKLAPRDFVFHAYANRRCLTEVVTAKGNTKAVEQSAARCWIEWPQRFELNKVVYKPGQPRIVDNCLNSWEGWGCEPIEGDVTPWKALLEHLFTGCPVERQWFEKWCAYPLQHPGAKLFTTVVLWGINTGTGKSLCGYTLKRIYGKNFTKIGDVELADARHEWAVNRQFVLGDDVTGQDQRKYADRLKVMITQREMRIDIKYVPSFTIDDIINYLFTSNHPDAFFLEDDDRRFFVHEVVVNPKPTKFYDDYFKWLDSGGAEALFHHLLTMDLGDFSATTRAPSTAAKQAMIADGQSDLGTWVRELRDNPNSILRIGGTQLQGDLWTAQELLVLYDAERRTRVTANGLARELKRAGMHQAYRGMPIRLSSGSSARLYVVRNSDTWGESSHLRDIVSHYEATRLKK